MGPFPPAHLGSGMGIGQELLLEGSYRIMECLGLEEGLTALVESYRRVA